MLVRQPLKKFVNPSYKYFPTKKKIKFEIVTDKRNCEAYGYVEKNEVNIFSKTEGSVISIICPDPYFYSAEDSLHTTVFYGVENEFEFEFSFLMNSLT